MSDPFDYVEPCEENCTPERHAYHQGQWDMAERMSQTRGTDMRAADPDDNTNGGYVAPNNKDGSGQTETPLNKYCPICGTTDEKYHSLKAHINHDGGIDLGQTETDELELWEGMFGNATAAKAGNYTIDYKDFMERVRRYSHHQTEQVLERLKEQSLPALWVASESKKLVYSEKPSEGVETELIDAELERLKEQSLPTNKDKEQA